MMRDQTCRDRKFEGGKMSNNLDLGARILEAAAHCWNECIQAVSAFFVSMFAGEASYTSTTERLGNRGIRRRIPHYVYAGFAGFIGYAFAKGFGIAKVFAGVFPEIDEWWIYVGIAGLCAHGGRRFIERMEKIRDAKLDAVQTKMIDRDKP